MIHNSPIILKKWTMNMRLCKEELTRIPVWVRIHDVPIQNQPVKATVPSTKEGNITMSNYYVALDDESDEDVENMYDELANLFHSTKTGESSSTFTAAAGKGIRVYKFNLSSKKEIDIVQLRVVNKAELKLLLRLKGSGTDPNMKVNTKMTWRLETSRSSSKEEMWDPNHLIEECPKPPKDKNQRAFVGGSWSDSGEEDDEKAKHEACLMAHASSKICLRIDLEPDEWIKYSGFSKHMTGNGKIFSTYKAYNEVKSLKDGKVIENSTLWHRRLGHVKMRLIQSLTSKELVRDLPKLKFDQHFCDACKIGKQAHASHKSKNIVSTTRCLELFHMDLFSPSAVQSY
ncbi:retrovirus-related pol polyprotein from transposon TNT 1-94 [Tanacetum coccineum]|uniref:Retrovirus-related pol polyprotein from transposon TNT 1-94 n=1 Tax=Tanacetum coccineum TaxID=301880 RepID=A0ABQ5FXZ2_9ASTR